MSSLENIYMKMSPTLEAADFANMHHESPHPDTDRQIGRDVAHELNNILTILRGYADRMILKHGDNPTLRPDLKLISENVKRAESLVRHATPSRPYPVSSAMAASPLA